MVQHVGVTPSTLRHAMMRNSQESWNCTFLCAMSRLSVASVSSSSLVRRDNLFTLACRIACHRNRSCWYVSLNFLSTYPWAPNKLFAAPAITAILLGYVSL